MTEFRNPVPGTQMKRPLRCIDLDELAPDPARPIQRVCQAQYEALARGSKFICPNRRAKNGRCQGGAFLYPRKWSKHGYFHFHQGIDLGALDSSTPEAQGRSDAGGLPILSVSRGEVIWRQDWDGETPGYGTTVGVYDEATRRLYWYAHCQAASFGVELHQIVEEGQMLARVGNTGKAGTPHLHFEVLDAHWGGRAAPFNRIKGGATWEQGIGTLHRDSPRLDPLKILQELGPWGPRQLFDPSKRKVNRARMDDLNTRVERTPGGFFPLGANNFWHGGVHLPMAAGTMVHSPLPGRIVACRLGATATTGTAAFGDLNFVLVRHELPAYVHAAMANHGRPVPAPAPTRGPSADTERGRIAYRVKGDNPPNLVRTLAAELRARGHYDADDDTVASGHVDQALYAAILAFQSTLPNPFHKPADQPRWPDGVVDVPGYTWRALFPDDSGDSDDSDDSETGHTDNVVYCLLMHLAPRAIGEVAGDAAWLSRARVLSSVEEAPPSTDEDSGTFEGAGPDSDHILSGAVQRGSTHAGDVRWVEARLIDLGLLTDRTTPTGTADAAFDGALRAFQRTYVWPDAPQNCDGVVSVGHRTDAMLREDDEALAQISADIAEGRGHTLSADVYEGASNVDDIRWVEARLIRRGLLTARDAPTGVADAPLTGAIVAFQRAHPWPHASKNWDGVVSAGHKTEQYLRRTGAQLARGGGDSGSRGGGKRAPLDPAFVAAVEAVDAEGKAAVVSGLSVPIAAGEPLWPSGVSSTHADTGAQTDHAELHWEIFSEAQLLPAWESIDDADDDLFVDVPGTLLSRADIDRSGLVSAEEIAEFYAQHPSAIELRKTACRFISEWGTNIDKTLARLDELGFSTAGLEAQLRPYQWWRKAADVLPGTAHVWHYNPVEFTATYQEVLDSFAPPPPIDPATQGNLRVRVRAVNGMPAKSPPTVAVHRGEALRREAEVGRDGNASFSRLAAERGYFVTLTDEPESWQIVDIVAGKRAEVELWTGRPGKKIPYGDLTVWVRKGSGGAAVGATVTMSDATGATHGPVTINKTSKVRFEGLAPGMLGLTVQYDATPEGQAPHDNDRVRSTTEIEFLGKDRQVTIKMPRAVCDVTVAYDDGGIAAMGVIADGDNPVAPLVTAGDGAARAQVPRGKYRIRFGTKSRRINARLAQLDYNFQ